MYSGINAAVSGGLDFDCLSHDILVKRGRAVVCPNESQIAAFVADAALAMTEPVEQHIDECTECRELLAGLMRSGNTDAWYPGQRLERYVLTEPIGRGGMGAVWRAEDTELGRPVALKRLHAGGREHVFREARTLAQLQHPNVVAVYEVVDDPAAPFLAMEFVSGVTLTAWLREERTVREIIAVLAQAGRGLAAAHARGLVHRDFKPDNVLVDGSPEGGYRARVADFGLASADLFPASADPAGCTLARATITAAGTPAYMAPEVVDGAPPDIRSDIYAFAVSVFEALHGHHPFEGSTVRTRWLEMAEGRIRDGKRQISRRLERCVRKGLAVDPAQRWPDIKSFVAALEWRPRRRIVVATAAAITTCALGLGGASVIASAAEQPDDCGAGMLEEAWSAPVRAATIARIGTHSLDVVPANATAQIIDHWGRAWQVGRRFACSAGPRRTARIACLDRELDELRGLIATWASGSQLASTVAAAAQLPAPGACNSAEDSPLLAQPLVMRITEAKTLWRTGRAALALPRMPGLIRDAEAIGHHDTLAQALLTASYIEHDAGADEAASQHARRAAAEASKSDDHTLLYAALVQSAYQRIDEGAPADALGMLDAAEAMSARGIPNPERVMIARGGALMRLGRTVDAVRAFDKAIETLGENAEVDPIARVALATALAGRGNAHLDGRDPEHARPDQLRALALQETFFGPRHPEVARTLYDLAQSETDLNQFDMATSHLDRAREIFVAAFGVHHPEVGQVDVARGTCLKRRGKFDEARAMFELAQQELAPSLRPDHLLFAVIENQLGVLEEGSDHCHEAIPHYQKAYAMLVANHAGGDEVASTNVALARCMLDLGNHVDAKTRAEAALDQLSQAGIDGAARAEPWMLLALVAEQRHERAKAIDYARKVMQVTCDADIGQAAKARKRMREKLAAWGAH